MTLKSNILRVVTIIFLVLTTLLLYHNLGRDYLFDWDESIYAQLGVEQNLSNFLTPTWNGELWLEKPPLIAHITALGSSLSSDPELGARLLIPVFTIITLGSVYVIGSSHLGGPVAASVATIILTSFDLFIGRSRSVNTDILLLAGITTAAALILKNAKPYLVAIALAFAIFAKGPAGILAVLITLPLFLTKDKKYFLLSTFYLLVYTLPWHVYQLLKNGADFYTPYLLEQVIRRVTVPIEFHLESRWFYFEHLYRDLGVGTLFAAFIGLIISLKQKKYLLSWWVFFPLCLFTIAKTRLSWYILPVYPAIALGIGYLFKSLARKINKKYSQLVIILVVGAALQSLLHLSRTIEYSRGYTHYPDHIKIASLLSQQPEPNIAYLVSASERTAEAILPDDQRLSSSFRYGGAPSLVFYSKKHVVYYYNYDHFTNDLINNLHTLAVVTEGDVDKVPPGYLLIAKLGSYYAYQKDSLYANR
ncbi:MAG: hypothetical protein Fur0011_6090 [Candidatus Microgenomates bacterium]